MSEENNTETETETEVEVKDEVTDTPETPKSESVSDAGGDALTIALARIEAVSAERDDAHGKLADVQAQLAQAQAHNRTLITLVGSSERDTVDVDDVDETEDSAPSGISDLFENK